MLGLIDVYMYICFGGSCVMDFVVCNGGKIYLEIVVVGGGIWSIV